MCEREQRTRQDEAKTESPKLASQPQLPFGTVVRLELGLTRGTNIQQHGVSWALFSSISSSVLSGARQSLLSTPFHRSAPAITPQIK